MKEQSLTRWKIKDTHLSCWRQLPGEYTAAQIWQMRLRGKFVAAQVDDETVSDRNDVAGESAPSAGS
jgi:hypothetical protein